MDATVTLGQQGRIVLPDAVRRALGLAPGDRLHLRTERGRLVLQRPADAVAALKELGADLPDRSLVDELLAERRAEARADVG